MTAKDKAIELHYKMCKTISTDSTIRIKDVNDAKQCALIAGEEIIYQMYDKYEIVDYTYWNEVKQEIINL